MHITISPPPFPICVVQRWHIAALIINDSRHMKCSLTRVVPLVPSPRHRLNSASDHPENNTHWHGFCKTDRGIERIATTHGQGRNTCGVWRDVMKEACCSDLFETPRQGLDNAMKPTSCDDADTTVCKSQTGKGCISPAPTCAQIREVDEQWGIDNGDLCTVGYWMTPPEDSSFPIAITTSRAHSHDPSLPGNTPETNTHWHPFCMTIDGVERIKTVPGAAGTSDNWQALWEGARSNAGCQKHLAKIPTTGLSMPKTGGGTAAAVAAVVATDTIPILVGTIVGVRGERERERACTRAKQTRGYTVGLSLTRVATYTPSISSSAGCRYRHVHGADMLQVWHRCRGSICFLRIRNEHRNHVRGLRCW